MANGNREFELVCQLLKLDLPQAHAVPVAATAVGRDHQTLGFGVALPPHRRPPPADGVDGKRFADGQIADDARVVTDGLASYDGDSLGERPHEAIVQTKAERGESDALQGCHWTISLLSAGCWARMRAR